MSHFLVFVVGNDLKGALAPFQENNMGDCPEQYLVFRDDEDDLLKEYEEQGTEMLQLATGERYFPWDERFQRITAMMETKWKYPAGSRKVHVLFKEIYASLDEYAIKWHGYTRRDPKTGKFGYWVNPNAKWDWYTLGGRWDGFFLTKSGTRANRLRKKDIDVAGMRDEAFGKYLEEWDDVQKQLAYMDPEHHVELRKRWLGIGDGCRFPETVTKEEWAEARSWNAMTPFAILKDGFWYERGRMGWWACVSDEKRPCEWEDQFQVLWDEIEDDEMIGAVDCHI